MCGHGNSLGALARLVQLIAPEIVPQTDTRAPATAPPQITCVRCHARVNTDYEWCPHCGVSLHATTCVYCGRRIAAGMDECPSCGAPVMGSARI